MAEVVCLGILVADVIARPVGAYPARGELALVESISPHIGGCAANTGISLGRLGVATSVVGKVGRDGLGDFVRAELERNGVQSQGVKVDESAPTSATLVMVGADAERSFLHCVGANALFGPDDVPWEMLRGARLLHIAGHFLMPGFDGTACAETLRRARSMGLLTSLDTAGRPSHLWAAQIAACLEHLDFFVPSLHEAAACAPPEVFSSAFTSIPEGAEVSPTHLERLAEYFLDRGVKTVALKMGERGSFVACADTSQGEPQLVPGFVVEAVDATGAGDAFAAGFLAGALRGDDLAACARLGNATGALCATEIGTVAGVRSLPETLRFIEEQETRNS